LVAVARRYLFAVEGVAPLAGPAGAGALVVGGRAVDDVPVFPADDRRRSGRDVERELVAPQLAAGLRVDRDQARLDEEDHLPHAVDRRGCAGRVGDALLTAF